MREKLNYSQEDLAELANISSRTLSHIECGDTFPSKVLLSVASALKVELPELFDFNHINLDNAYIMDYIRTNIEFLSSEELMFLYRIIKSLR